MFHALARTKSLASRSLAAAVVCLAALGCSKSLPDFAAPKSSGASSVDPRGGDLIRYRKLERSDFKSTTPPPVVQQGPYVLGAQTCAHVRTSPDTQIDLLSTKQPNGETRHEGRLRNVRFFAYMDRSCSWWNPTNDDVAYTLEHEQIHFAISELQARRLNQAAEKLKRDLHVVAGSKEEVVNRVQEELNELLEEHNEDALERNHEFDSETSVGRNPARQREWLKKVNRELEETKAWR